jgi:hypothetical protein
MTHPCGKSHNGRLRTVEATVAPVRVEKFARRLAPTREEIAARAYSYWDARGRQGGSSEEDWLRAERELSGGI